MPDALEIKNTETLSELRGALARFAGDVQQALRATQEQIRQTREWLDERVRHWQSEVGRAAQMVQQARAAAARCESSGYRDRDGRRQQPDCSREWATLQRAEEHLRQCQENLRTAQAWRSKISQAADAYNREARRLEHLAGDHSGRAQAELAGLRQRYEAVLQVQVATAIAGAITGGEAGPGASLDSRLSGTDTQKGGIEDLGPNPAAADSLDANGRINHNSSYEKAALEPEVENKIRFGVGVCGAEKIGLRNDGSGMFKEMEYPGSYHDGHCEVAAHRTSELLGLSLVPDTAYTQIEGRTGTMQLFLENARVGSELPPGEAERLISDNQEQFAKLAALDDIIGNVDRHRGNWMWDGENVWAIDHGHATFNYAVDLDPRRSTAYRFFGRERTFVSQKTVDQWRGITYERFDQALGTDGRPAEGVQASWERLQEIIRHNGEVTWFLHI